MAEIYGFDAYSPQEVALKVEEVGVVKARAPLLEKFILGVVAGGFISLGGLFYTFVLIAEPELGWATARLIGGVVFAVGYIMAVLAGAEVFTSNNLLAMTWAARKISIWDLLRHWSVIIVANFAGALGMVALFLLSDLASLGEGRLGECAIRIGVAKSELTFNELFGRAVLGNLCVCIAVWISIAGRSVTDKVVAMILPLSALGALQLEHIVAIFYYMPRTILMAWFQPEFIPEGVSVPGVLDFIRVAFPVILGNIIGGSFMVAFVYHIIYRRQPSQYPSRRK